MNTLRRVFVLLLGTTILSACGGSDDDDTAAPISPSTVASKTIVEVAQADPQFSVLVEAVVAAGLVNTLNGAGPFTVFAPTNDAFVKLLADLKLTKAQLLADKTLLTKVLTYHVVSGKVLKAQVPIDKDIATVEGSTLKVDATLAIKDQRNRSAKIIATDVAASNGVIHVIDTVILPKDDNTITNLAIKTPQLSILVEAVVAAGLDGVLNGLGPNTVFAPTNDAFAALLTELNITKAALLADKPLLTKVLTYHVLGSKVLKANVPLNTPITTLQGSTFTVDNTLTIIDARNRRAGITATDIEASNGVVHLINKVILPPAN